MDKIVDVDATLIGETEKAYLFDFGNDKETWVPKSIVSWDADDEVVSMPENFALNKGII